MPLETLIIQALTPRALPYKVADGKGLYILVTPTGKKLWRLKYRWEGKEGTLSFGAYPMSTWKQHANIGTPHARSIGQWG